MAKNLNKLKKILIFRLQRHKDFNRTITGSLNTGKAKHVHYFSILSGHLTGSAKSGQSSHKRLKPKTKRTLKQSRYTEDTALTEETQYFQVSASHLGQIQDQHTDCKKQIYSKSSLKVAVLRAYVQNTFFILSHQLADLRLLWLKRCQDVLPQLAISFLCE